MTTPGAGHRSTGARGWGKQNIINYNAVKAQTSLAPLSRFRGSRVTTNCACTPMLYISELCEDCAVANEIDYDIDDA